MSLYRQVGRSRGWLAASVVVALVFGFGLGFAVARVTADEPTLADAVADTQAEAGTTADALELVGLHYRGSREAARAQLEAARESFSELEADLRLLAPAETRAAAEAVARVVSLVDRRAPAGAVEAAAEAARGAVRRAARVR